MKNKKIIPTRYLDIACYNSYINQMKKVKIFYLERNTFKFYRKKYEVLKY